MEKMNALDCLMEYRNNKDKYLPMIDHETTYFPPRTEYDDTNIGWDCGFIGNRPYFLECWATSGITMITIFLSTKGIEDYSVEDLEKLLIEEGKIYAKKEGYESPEFAPKPVDGNGNEFFSFNVVAGIEDEPARIEGGGQLVPFSKLNELNGFAEEKERITYKKIGFRGVNKRFMLLPLDDREMRNVLGDYPRIEEADYYLGYGYIDHEAGVTIEVLALAKVGEEVEIFDANPNHASTKIRIGELTDTPMIIVNDGDGRIRNEFAEILDIIDEGYTQNDMIEESREYDFLDEFRDERYIDDVRVILYKENLKPEEVWVRIEGTKDHTIVGTLIVEPYQDYGVHKGDEVAFQMHQIEDRLFCICEVE